MAKSASKKSRKAGATLPEAAVRAKWAAERRAVSAAKAAGGTFIGRQVQIDDVGLYFGNASSLLEVLALAEPHRLDESTVSDALWGIKSLIDSGRTLLFGESEVQL